MQHNPLLIAGEGRSGTTLLSVILDSHPDLAVGPELHFRVPINLGVYIMKYLEMRISCDDESWERYRFDMEGRNAFHFINRTMRFGISSVELRSLINKEMVAGNLLNTFSERTRLVEAIIRIKQQKKRARLWGFKIMRELSLFRDYLSVWPNAVFIHVVRDGRDVAASQIKDHPTWGYRSIEEAAACWTQIFLMAKDVPSDKFFELRYEDLVREPEKTTLKLTEFLEIPWLPALLHHYASDADFIRKTRRHPSLDKVKKPLTARAIGRYKNDLTRDDVRQFEILAGPDLDRLGYERDFQA